MELYKTDKSPYTVVLCTFYGAAHRVRQKYADMWVKKGLSVITVSVGVPDANSRAIERESNSDLLGRAKAALDTLIANGLDKQLLIFHVISEGGTSSWLRLIQLMESKSTVRQSMLLTYIYNFYTDTCLLCDVVRPHEVENCWLRSRFVPLPLRVPLYVQSDL